LQRELFSLLTRVVPRLPPRLTRPMATIAGALLFRAADGMRANAMENIAHLLDLPAEHRTVRRAALGACCTLVRNYVDMLTLTTLSATQVSERTEVCGLEHLLSAQARGGGALMASAHLGNADQVGQALLVRGARCAVITEAVKPDWLFDFFARERSHFGGQVIPFTPGVLPQLQRVLREGMALGIACDWDMQGNGIPVDVGSRRGHVLRIPAGVALLALRSKAPIIPIFGERLPDGRTRCHIEPELKIAPTGNVRADMQQIAALIAGRMLPRLRAHPEQWVLFHRVWEIAPGPA